MKKNIEEIKCPNCEKKFIPKSRLNKWCSYECNYEYKRKHYKKKTIQKKKICKNCKKEFLTHVNNQIFCCIGCNREYYKKLYESKSLSIINQNNRFYSNFLRLRFEILKRDNFTCQYCGRNVKDDKIKLNVDHIIPKAKGGEDTYENLITSCQECNLGKDDVLLSFRKEIKENVKN